MQDEVIINGSLVITKSLTSFADLLPASIEEINAHIGRTDIPAFLYIFSNSCEACTLAKPTVELIYQEYKNLLPFALVNAEKTPEVWKAFGLSKIPTCLVVGNDQALIECNEHIDAIHLRQAIAKGQQLLQDITAASANA